MGWTLATAREQPFEDILLLAADAIMEAESVTSGREPPSFQRDGRPRTSHSTVIYEAA